MPNRNDRTLEALQTRATPLYLGRAAAHATAILLAIALLGSGYIDCPLAVVFHVPCPSCGSTRAARALFALDLRGAFHMHPVAPVIIVLSAALAVRWVIAVARDGSSRSLGRAWFDRVLLRLLLVGVVLEIAVWILRFFGLLGGPLPV